MTDAMTYDKQRDLRIRTTILEDLDNTPRGYMQSQRSLTASVCLLLVPPPSDAELDHALARLEADCQAHCEVSPLGEKRWCITGIGRAALHAR